MLISDDGQIIAGQGRIEAAKLLQIERVPTLCLSHLSDAERRAYILADNKLAQNAGWDREILALELQGLLYQVSEWVTRWGVSRIGRGLIQDGKYREVCHDGGDFVAG